MVSASLPVHDGSKFTWHGETGCVDASDLALACTRQSMCSRVWDDACDVGFWVLSPKTGKKVLFTFEAEAKSPDGETMSWLFRAYDPTANMVSNITITIYND